MDSKGTDETEWRRSKPVLPAGVHVDTRDSPVRRDLGDGASTIVVELSDFLWANRVVGSAMVWDMVTPTSNTKERKRIGPQVDSRESQVVSKFFRERRPSQQPL